ncbi:MULTISPECIES: TadE family protein [unclassified Leifsonia]|uniref:TadE family protein n=1 Tax=unclassified Leifsonia TaxID=2663824 RepID=UPI001F1BF1FE|nr:MULTISPECIES: TadE family protein [unclassified Leifsonia]
MGLILLVPLVYLVLAVSSIQAASLAAEGTARQMARVYVQATTPEDGLARIDRALAVGFDDYGLASADTSAQVGCTDGANGCLSRGNTVTVTVRLRIVLPLVPDVVALRDVASIPLEARATQQVSRFWTDSAPGVQAEGSRGGVG